jgi:hypothetical protein
MVGWLKTWHRGKTALQLANEMTRRFRERVTYSPIPNLPNGYVFNRGSERVAIRPTRRSVRVTLLSDTISGTKVFNFLA